MFNIRETLIVQHNVRHYANNLHALHSDWDSLNPDVILLNSTSIPKNPGKDYKLPTNIKYKDYKVYETEQGEHNGSAILVKRSLQHSVTKTGSEHLLAITLTTNKGLLTLSTYYRPFKDTKQNSSIPHLLFKQLFNRSHPVFLLADLNIKHKCLGSSKNTKEGIEFVEKCLNKTSNINYIGPDFNTFFQSNKNDNSCKKTKCDLIFGNKASSELHQYIAQGNQNGSDHTAIIFKVSSKPIHIKVPERINTEKANWKGFKNVLLKYKKIEVDGINSNQLSQLTKDIIDTVSNVTKHREIFPVKSHITYANAPAKSDKTIQLEMCINNLDAKLRKQYSAPSVVQSNLKNYLRNEFKQSRIDDRSNHFLKIANSIDSSYKKTDFWKKVNETKGNYANKPTTIDGIEDPKQVNDIFEKKWKTVFRSNKRTLNPRANEKAFTYLAWHATDEAKKQIEPHKTVDLSRLKTPSKEDLKNDFHRAQLLAPIELEDVKYFISRLKNKKAPGESGITNIMLKNLPDEFTENIVKIYNASLSMGYFPQSFKSAIMIMIHKKGKSKDDPLNYRPISLLESIGKIYEQILNRRLKWFLEDSNQLNDCQFGFRPSRSTHTSIHTMIEFINQAHKRGLDVFAISKDIEKAFDRVHHPSLIYKIFNNFNLPELFCKSLSNFLVERKIKIKINDVYSNEFTPEAGVPQGSVLGPLLYLMFINDAPKTKPTLIKSKTNKNIIGHFSEINLYFADDNVIMVAGYKEPGNKNSTLFGNARFRLLVQESTDWEEANRIKTNANKSRLMYFSPKNNTRPGKYINLTLHPNLPDDIKKANKANDITHENIAFTQSHKILGVTFDSKLTFKKHINITKASIRSSVISLRSLNNTSIKTKTLLSNAILQPKITYSYPIYPSLNEGQRTNYQKCQNHALYRFVLSHIPWEHHPNAENLHVQLRMKSIAQISWERSKKFYRKLAKELPQLYEQFSEFIHVNIWGSEKQRAAKKPSPLQFAKGPRPPFIYSENHRS